MNVKVNEKQTTKNPQQQTSTHTNQNKTTKETRPSKQIHK